MLIINARARTTEGESEKERKKERERERERETLSQRSLSARTLIYAESVFDEGVGDVDEFL